ncbi:MAG: transposase [Anaerolineaceae bacterium]
MKFIPLLHHRHSIRLPGYDYSQAGVYFITICTYEKEPLFGTVTGGKMVLNEYGLLIESEWKRIPNRFPLLLLGVFMIMPNHTHGIIKFMEKSHVGARQGAEINSDNCSFASPLPANPSLGMVVGAFKSTSARLFNGLRHSPSYPVWQRNYYEHIIRDDDSYLQIVEYILSNPASWEQDDLFHHP